MLLIICDDTDLTEQQRIFGIRPQNSGYVDITVCFIVLITIHDPDDQRDIERQKDRQSDCNLRKLSDIQNDQRNDLGKKQDTYLQFKVF